jgi:hypothetical protein
MMNLQYIAAACALLSASAAFAGRPLTVDDANMNDAGAGHVETWIAREAGKVSTFNIAPAFSPLDNIEIGALLSRNTTDKITTSAVQAKWRITASQDKGCNLAAVVGLSHNSEDAGNIRYANAIVGCNGNALGNVFVNLGVVKAPDEKSRATWGLALERAWGSVTPHIEAFGIQHEKPTVQMGLRSQLNKTIQIDGTLGRKDRENLLSVGMKFQF